VRIGRLSPLSVAADAPMLTGLRQGLSELGWIEGRNLAFELRFAEGNVDRLPQLADELVRAKVDVIVTGSSPGASAAKNATSNHRRPCPRRARRQPRTTQWQRHRSDCSRPGLEREAT
jgi:hypothetical protein